MYLTADMREKASGGATMCRRNGEIGRKKIWRGEKVEVIKYTVMEVEMF